MVNDGVFAASRVIRMVIDVSIGGGLNRNGEPFRHSTEREPFIAVPAGPSRLGNVDWGWSITRRERSRHRLFLCVVIETLVVPLVNWPIFTFQLSTDASLCAFVARLRFLTSLLAHHLRTLVEDFDTTRPTARRGTSFHSFLFSSGLSPSLGTTTLSLCRPWNTTVSIAATIVVFGITAATATAAGTSWSACR
jgi:hypothetical protein